MLVHERRNGQFLLQVTGHPTYGVPWGQDRLVPIFLATLAMRQQKQTITFRSAAEMLDIFGMQQGGSQYRRLIAAFQRVFGATIFFGTDTQTQKAAVMHHARFSFMREARIWYSPDPNQALLPGGFENEIVLSDEFFREVTAHSIATDLEAAKALSSAPAALDLFSGCPIAASPPRGENVFRFSAISAWPRSLGVSITPGHANFVSGLNAGWISFAPCGRLAPPASPATAATC